MKGLLCILILVAIFAAWNSTPVLNKHHQGAVGVYFLRDYCSVSTPNGIVGWTPGQELREDLRAPMVPGSRTISDGKYSTLLPETLLSKDIEDAESLRVTDSQEQAQIKASIAALNERAARSDFAVKVATSMNINRHNAAMTAASTVGRYASALNDSSRRVGGGSTVYYGYPILVGSTSGFGGTGVSGGVSPTGVQAGITQVNRNQAASEATMRNRPPLPATTPPVGTAW